MIFFIPSCIRFSHPYWQNENIKNESINLRQGDLSVPSYFGSHQRRTVSLNSNAGTMTVCIRLSFRDPLRFSRVHFSSSSGLPVCHQMSHSLSLEVIEIAEVAALLDKLASGLEAGPSRSTGPSSSAKDRTEPWDMTCCCNLFFAAAALSLCLRFLNQFPTCVGVSPVACASSLFLLGFG